jgi:putative transposase
MLTPTARRRAMTVMTSRGLSTRAAARGLGVSRSVEHYTRKQPGTDAKLSGRLRDLSPQFPRFGYRRVAAWLNVGDKRLWRLCSRIDLAPSSPTAQRQRHPFAHCDVAQYGVELRLRPRSHGQ